MLTLAIETATDRVGCAVADDDAVVATFELTQGRRHVESLLPAVDACLAQIGASVDQLGAVVADVGPGLFTGLRVGLATARSLAFALDLDRACAAVTSLEAMAQGARLSGRLLCPVIDARRGEVFWQLFRADDDGPGVRPLGEARCTPPEELAGELRVLREPLAVCGDGVTRYAAVLDDVDEVLALGPEHAYPSAAVLLGLGLRELRQGRGVSGAELEPRYLRAPDAAINWATRDGQVRA